jgi:hypothetical protein
MNLLIRNIKSTITNIIGVIIEKLLLFFPLVYIIIVLCDFVGHGQHTDHFARLLINNVISVQINTLTTVSAVLIGFYVTTMSVFGTSLSSSILKISKSKLVDKFIEYSVTALVSAFIFLLLSIFLNVLPDKLIKVHIYFALFLFMITAAIRFAFIVILMYRDNIDSANKIIEQDKKERERLLALLSSMETCLRLKSNEKQASKIQEIARTQRKSAPEIPKI